MTRLKQGYDGLNIPAPYSSVVLSDNPIAYWRLNDRSSAVVDSSGNGSTGTISATGITEGSPGIILASVQSMVFDGVSGGIKMGDPAVLVPTTTNGLSFELWYASTFSSPINTATIGGRMSVWPTNNAGDLSYDFVISWNLNADVGFRVSRDGTAGINFGGSMRIITSPLQYNDGLPHHVVGTLGIPTAPQVLALYVDGQLVNSASFSGGSGSPVWPPNNGPSAVQFSTQPVNAGGIQLFPGKMGEIAVYNYALSPARILAHYQAGKPFVGQCSTVDRPVNTVSAYDYP